MLPIHKVLARIRWDEIFANAEFIIGYEDRFSPNVIFVPLDMKQVRDDRDTAVTIINAEGERIAIPLHRIRVVKRGGRIIWRRPTPEPT